MFLQNVYHLNVIDIDKDSVLQASHGACEPFLKKTIDGDKKLNNFRYTCLNKTIKSYQYRKKVFSPGKF